MSVTLKFQLTICSVILASSLLWSQPVLVPQELHPVVGISIDSVENARYNLFGDIKGFYRATIYYDQKQHYYLHIALNFKDRGNLKIIRLRNSQFVSIKNKLQERVQLFNEGLKTFPDAIFNIPFPPITERKKFSRMELDDGSEFVVQILKARGDSLLVQTRTGLKMYISDKHIKSIRELKGMTAGSKFSRTDPNHSRLFFGPTARRLKKGDGYFADYYIFFPTIAIGITNSFSLAGGVSLIPGASSQLLYLAPKLTFELSPKIGIATGFLYLAVPGNTNNITLGYAVTTYGSDTQGITVGFGLPLMSDVDFTPILLVGLEKQIGNRIKFISENWIFPGDETTILFSGGVRFFGKSLAADFALITTQDFFGASGLPFVPWVSFSFFFGG
ncbi:MAG: hypothetical protein GXO77_08520 [Calditrichaeota bacterium]|nr:hypothetical protein [Calditrichota bacterium]